MKITLLKHKPGQQAPRLILLFAGWGMDAIPIRDVKVSGHDIAVAYDYRDVGFEEAESLAAGYKEIVVAAWSFGTPAAARFIALYESKLAISRCLAINGTLYPEHDNMGIPSKIFRATLNGLTPASLLKFYRRMCGSAKEREEFLGHVPQRDFEELGPELEAIAGIECCDDGRFDVAYVADNDLIIPSENQRRCWEAAGVGVVEIEGGHLPDFSKIFNREVVDKARVERSFASALATYDSRATVQHIVARRLLNLWREFAPLPEVGEVVEFGVGSGYYSRLLDEVLPKGVRLRLWDLAPSSPEVEQRDAESSILDEGEGVYQAVTASSTVQWFNSLPRFMSRCVRALAPGGVAAFSTYGPLTYSELAPYQQSRPHYLSVEELLELLGRMKSRGEISRYVVKDETTKLQFLTPGELLAHLRESGVNATQTPDVRSALALVRARLRSLTYQPVYILVEK